MGIPPPPSLDGRALYLWQLNLFLGILMLSYGYWLGLLPLAASAVLFWAGARVYQITQSQPAASLAGVHGR